MKPLTDWLERHGNAPFNQPARVWWQHHDGVPRDVTIFVIVDDPDGDHPTVTIRTIDRGHEATTETRTFGTLAEVTGWLEKRLYPTEHDLNNAWGV